MSRPYSHRSGPYEDPTLYDDDASATAATGAPADGGAEASYTYDNQSARNDYGIPAHEHQQGATDAPYSAPSYPRARGYDRGSQVGFPETGKQNRDTGDGSSRATYTDRDKEGYHSDHQQTGVTGGSRRTPPHHSTGAPSNLPSRTLILEGLPFEMTQEDIANELRNNFHASNLDEVRLIKDKRTGLSRQFAFTQFAAVADAKVFYESNQPFIQFKGTYRDMYGDTRSGDKNPYVTIAFSREKDERPLPGQGENDWMCEVALQARELRDKDDLLQVSRTTHDIAIRHGIPAGISGFTGFITTGVHDVSSVPSQFLLFRSLDTGVTEELLARGATKLCRNTPSPPAAEGLPNKKAKIASTSADPSVGAKIGTLRRVLLVKDRKDNHSWKYGFAEFASVEDAVAAMAKYNSTERFTISSKPVQVSYIHAGVFIPVLQSAVPVDDRFTFSPLGNPVTKLMYWDQAAYCKELVVEKQKTDMEKMKEKVAAAAKRAQRAAADEGLLGPPKEKDIASAKKRKAEKDKKSAPMAPHLEFWANRHAEVHGLPPVAPGAEGVFSAGSANTTTTTASTPDPADRNEAKPQSQSFADVQKMCCLLCRQQFKTKEAVTKHELKSKIHSDNIKNEELIKETLRKWPKLRSESAEDDGSYRDRAKERRQQFAQSKQPRGKRAAPPAEEKDETVKPADNKAAKMLEKMGWTAGQGLGAEGTGRTEAISTELYAQGVGLGAVGGKVGDAVEEANKATGSTYADFLQKGKDKARERFGYMQ